MCTDTTYRIGRAFSIAGFVQLREVPSSEVIRESMQVTRILLRVHGSLLSGCLRWKIRTAWLPYDQSHCAGTAPNPARNANMIGTDIRSLSLCPHRTFSVSLARYCVARVFCRYVNAILAIH